MFRLLGLENEEAPSLEVGSAAIAVVLRKYSNDRYQT